MRLQYCARVCVATSGWWGSWERKREWLDGFVTQEGGVVETGVVLRKSWTQSCSESQEHAIVTIRLRGGGVCDGLANRINTNEQNPQNRIQVQTIYNTVLFTFKDILRPTRPSSRRSNRRRANKISCVIVYLTELRLWTLTITFNTFSFLLFWRETGCCTQ